MRLPKIVRYENWFSDRESLKTIESRIAETKRAALKYAKYLGIKSPDITEMYTIQSSDYPMYLLGPGTPRIKTIEDALLYGDGRGKYIIIIR